MRPFSLGGPDNLLVEELGEIIVTPSANCRPRVIVSLTALYAWTGRKLLIFWSGVRQHRSKMMHQLGKVQQGTIELNCLPDYALGLGRAECIWSVSYIGPAGTCAP